MVKEDTGMQGLAHIVGGRDSIDPPSGVPPESDRMSGRSGSSDQARPRTHRSPPPLREVAPKAFTTPFSLKNASFCELENSFCGVKRRSVGFELRFY